MHDSVQLAALISVQQTQQATSFTRTLLTCSGTV